MAGSPPPPLSVWPTLRSLAQQPRGRGTRRAGPSAEEEELSRRSSQRQGREKQTGHIHLNGARRAWVLAAHWKATGSER